MKTILYSFLTAVLLFTAVPRPAVAQSQGQGDVCAVWWNGHIYWMPCAHTAPQTETPAYDLFVQYKHVIRPR